jgi:hypothetical protein
VAWYNNQYICPECSAVWDSEWSCASDDQCPECEERNITPVSRQDLTVVVEPNSDGSWEIWRSSPEAEDKPRYEMLGTLNPCKSRGLKFVKRAISK